MAKEHNDFFLDIRALKLNLKRKNITRKEYDAHLKNMPDLSDQLIEISA